MVATVIFRLGGPVGIDIKKSIFLGEIVKAVGPHKLCLWQGQIRVQFVHWQAWPNSLSAVSETESCTAQFCSSICCVLCKAGAKQITWLPHVQADTEIVLVSFYKHRDGA